MHIINWKLALLAFFCICFFSALGFWQLSRAQQKEILIESYTARMKHSPLSAKDLKAGQDLRFFRVVLQGQFDNAHTFLLDNKTFHGQVGYEIYTPFKAEGMAMPLLIDRGFIPLTKQRSEQPLIKNILGTVKITGLLNLPPRFVEWGKLYHSPTLQWPLRVEFINLTQLSEVLNQHLFAYILALPPGDSHAYPIDWQIVVMGPEKHRGYAVQWFALALTVLTIALALAYKRRSL